MRIFWHKCAIQGIFGGYQDHLGPSGPILRLSIFLIGYLGPWGLMGALKNIWGPIRGILGLFWHYLGVIVAAPGKLGALSTILWLSVLFGGYLGAVSAIWRSLVLFGCDRDFWGS